MVAQPSPSEIVNLLLVIVLVPLSAVTVARFRRPGSRFLVVGYLSVVVAIVLAVLEHPLQVQLLSDLKNVLYAIGGLGFATGIWQLNLAVRRGEV